MEATAFSSIGAIGLFAVPAFLANLIGGGGLPTLALYTALSVTPAPLPPAAMPHAALVLRLN